MQNSKIEWTDHTFNPWVGCTKISPACDHCYAEAWDKRYGGDHWGPKAPRRRTSEANWRAPLKLMQEPSRAMEEIGSGNGTPRNTGWKKPLKPGMRVACTLYDEYERAANCFKDMRDQLIREIEE